MTLLSVLAFGFLLGMKHATEADHLAAVATLATRQGGNRWDALRQGAAWGLGHTLTLMLFGGIVMVMGKSVPPWLEQGLELVVGVMLLLLGADVLRRLWQRRVHFHLHRHEGDVLHVHAHSHAGEGLGSRGNVPVAEGAQFSFVPDRSHAHRGVVHEHPHPAPLQGRALLIGMVHGMAGSAALIVLSLGKVGSMTTGLLYILLFGAGSMLGMALLSMVIAVPLHLSGRLLTGLHRGMTAAVGLFSCGLGLWVIYRIGVVDGLLLAAL